MHAWLDIGHVHQNITILYQMERTCQHTTYRNHITTSRMVTRPITSHIHERSRSWPRHMCAWISWNTLGIMSVTMQHR